MKCLLKESHENSTRILLASYMYHQTVDTPKIVDCHMTNVIICLCEFIKSLFMSVMSAEYTTIAI